jgi:hypothetical protein
LADGVDLIVTLKIKIRDWDLHFEQDRSRQWKNLKWVPIPNKQGSGYRRIMKEKNGVEIFGCWIALVQAASLCTPRGDLSKYNIADLSLLTFIDENKLLSSITYLSDVLDWVEVIENLDKSVNHSDISVSQPAVGSSILFSSVLSNSSSGKSVEKTILVPEHLVEIWPDFLLMRRSIKRPATERAQKNIFAALEKMYPGETNMQIVSVEQSITNSWQGVFKIKEDFKGRKQTGFDAEKYKRENGLV